jgi:hypothetical protein
LHLIYSLSHVSFATFFPGCIQRNFIRRGLATYMEVLCTIVTPIYCVCTLQTKLYWHWTFCRCPLKSITKLPITLKLARNSYWEIWWKWFKKKKKNRHKLKSDTAQYQCSGLVLSKDLRHFRGP